MLAPGDCLINPVPPEPNRELVTPRAQAELISEPKAALAVKAEEPETSSFLLMLLHALSAVHT
jgi:hypothetical protein